MSGQDAKNKETESKIMGAAEAVTALIDAVTKESADGVRAAAERFKKDTKSDINSLGDANGRTPMHLVRARAFPRTRAEVAAALSKRTARAPRATAAAARSREKKPSLPRFCTRTAWEKRQVLSRKRPNDRGAGKRTIRGETTSRRRRL